MKFEQGEAPEIGDRVRFHWGMWQGVLGTVTAVLEFSGERSWHVRRDGAKWDSPGCGAFNIERVAS